MLNSPIDDLMETLNRVKEENVYLKNQLAQYKRLGQIQYQGLSNYCSQIKIKVDDDLICVEFGKKQLVLTPADMVMLANLNGLFESFSGGCAYEERC